MTGIAAQRASRQTQLRRSTVSVIGPAKIYFVVFGLLTIVGGVMGTPKPAARRSLSPA
jgi:hypothetical protein